MKQQQIALKLQKLDVKDAGLYAWWGVVSLVLQANTAASGATDSRPHMCPRKSFFKDQILVFSYGSNFGLVIFVWTEGSPSVQGLVHCRRGHDMQESLKECPLLNCCT